MKYSEGWTSIVIRLYHSLPERKIKTNLLPLNGDFRPKKLCSEWAQQMWSRPNSLHSPRTLERAKFPAKIASHQVATSIAVFCRHFSIERPVSTMMATLGASWMMERKTRKVCQTLISQYICAVGNGKHWFLSCRPRPWRTWFPRKSPKSLFLALWEDSSHLIRSPGAWLRRPCCRGGRWSQRHREQWVTGWRSSSF